MKNFIKNSLIFIGGAAVGGGATYLYLIKKIQNDVDEIRDYYETRAKDFEENVKEKYTIERSAMDDLDTPEKLHADMAKNKPSLSEIDNAKSLASAQEETSKVRYDKVSEDNAEIVDDNPPTKAPDPVEEEDELEENLEPEDLVEDVDEEEEVVDPIDEPYSIEVEEYDSNEEFDKIGYAIYPNGKIYNEDDLEMDKVDVEKSVGKDMLKYFMTSGKKNLYVRNEVERTDYELVKIFDIAGHPQKG